MLARRSGLQKISMSAIMPFLNSVDGGSTGIITFVLLDVPFQVGCRLSRTMTFDDFAFEFSIR